MPPLALLLMSAAKPEVTLYTHGLCPYAQRVALALQAKAVPHERVEIDLSDKPPWYAATAGTTLVPAVKWADGRTQAESLDICRALDEEFPREPWLVPRGREREAAALVARCADVERAGWAALGGSWSFPRTGKVKPGQAQRLREALRPLAASCEQSGGPFLLGESLSLADCALAPFVVRFALVLRALRGWDPLAEDPALERWLAALRASPAWRATFPSEGPFLEAVGRYGSLDYFDYRTASLARPLPRE